MGILEFQFRLCPAGRLVIERIAQSERQSIRQKRKEANLFFGIFLEGSVGDKEHPQAALRRGKRKCAN